ncbi:hypothetical protein L341_1131 [Escherichia coli CE418]|nr:hypothetical protein L341_1131 [Escherichia coli CE418]HAJ3361514.1 hypothetical protein [Escherichia coli]
MHKTFFLNGIKRRASMRLICNGKQHAGGSQCGYHHLFHNASCEAKIIVIGRLGNVFYLSVAILL